MSSLDYLDLCRLCLVKDRVSVPIFEGEGDVRQIFLKIAACLPVKVAREDKLPKKICDDCVYKVELFYQFWNTTANAEKQLLQWLGEVGMDGKQGYVTNTLNQNVMKQEQQSAENRLDGSVMQQVGEHQNNMGMGMMDNMGLGIPMMMPSTNQQQLTSVPMDTSGNSVQTVQAVPGPSSQTTHNQISQSQTSSTQQEEEEESSEEEENSDEECDGDEGLPVKEESEEDPNSRTIEPTTFVNVSLACDEAGPSGLQQQKISDIPEMPMQQPADGDPKSGPAISVRSARNSSATRDTSKYHLLASHNAHAIKQEREDDATCNINIKMEIPDQSPEDTPNEVFEEQFQNCPAGSREGVPHESYQGVPHSSPDEAPQSLPAPLNTELPKNLPMQLPMHFLEQVGSAAPLLTIARKEKIQYLRKFVCEVCHKAFGSNYNLRKHLKTHGMEPTYQCSVCHEQLKNKKSLEVHMDIHKGATNIFQCSECGFLARRQYNVKRHQIRTHTKLFRFHCHLCPKMFNLNTDFRRHMKRHVIAPRYCEYCGQTFKNEYYFRVHRLQRKPIRFRCKGSLCDGVKAVKKEQVEEEGLEVKKTGEQYKCPQCKWSFQNWKSLRKHLKRHTLRYNCDKCTAVYKYEASFLKHKATHKN